MKDDEVQRWAKDVMKWLTRKDVKKVIVKKFEDGDECKGGGLLWKNSIQMKKFKNQCWGHPWRISISIYLQGWNGSTYEEHHLTLDTKREDMSSIIKRRRSSLSIEKTCYKWRNIILILL